MTDTATTRDVAGPDGSDTYKARIEAALDTTEDGRWDTAWRELRGCGVTCYQSVPGTPAQAAIQVGWWQARAGHPADAPVAWTRAEAPGGYVLIYHAGRTIRRRPVAWYVAEIMRAAGFEVDQLCPNYTYPLAVFAGGPAAPGATLPPDLTPTG